MLEDLDAIRYRLRTLAESGDESALRMARETLDALSRARLMGAVEFAQYLIASGFSKAAVTGALGRFTLLTQLQDEDPDA